MGVEMMCLQEHATWELEWLHRVEIQWEENGFIESNLTKMEVLKSSKEICWKMLLAELWI